MGPQREAAIRYLTAQIAKYRTDLSLWRRRAGRAGAGLTKSMIITPLQDLIEDGAQLIARLRGRLGSPSETGSETKSGKTESAAERQDG